MNHCKEQQQSSLISIQKLNLNFKQEVSKHKTKFSVQIQINMPSIMHLNTIWEHTLNEILNHNNKTEVGIIMRSWVKHNKLEEMTDLLIYDLTDFYQCSDRAVL